MRHVLLLCAIAAAMSAGVVDRIAIIIGRQVITELQLDEEVLVTAFLNRQPVIRDSETTRAAANRLIEQVLIETEMKVGAYPLPGEEDVNQYIEQIRGNFGSAAEWHAALARYGLSEDVLKDHLALQLMTLRFIEFRFRPDVDVSDADVENAYRQQTATWRAQHFDAPPSFEASRESIRNTLIEERVDRELDAWIARARKRSNVVYRDTSLE